MNTNPKGENASATQSKKLVRGRRTLFIRLAMVVVFLGALLWVALSPALSPSEPKCDGIKLSTWLDRYYKSEANPQYYDSVDGDPQRDQPYEAIRGIGSNAVPSLIRWLKVSDSDPSLKGRLKALLQKQSLIKFHFKSAAEYHDFALGAFQLLGPELKSALPGLEKLLQNPETRADALSALHLLRSEALPGFIYGLTNADPEVRRATAREISDEYGWEFHRVSPPTLEPAPLNIPTPLLVRLLQDSESDIRVSAMVLLSRSTITNLEYAGAIVPLLAQELTSTNKDERAGSLAALANFGSDAKSAAPALVARLQDKDEDVRIAATNALRMIDPKAAPNNRYKMKGVSIRSRQ